MALLALLFVLTWYQKQLVDLGSEVRHWVCPELVSLKSDKLTDPCKRTVTLQKSRPRFQTTDDLLHLERRLFAEELVKLSFQRYTACTATYVHQRGRQFSKK